MNAITALLNDHKMIRKMQAEVRKDKTRTATLMKTLHRIVRGHAWFEDQIFIPAFEAEPLIARRFMDQLYQEHKDIDFLLKLVRDTPVEKADALAAYGLQLETVLDTHFKKEEDALFPLAARILTEEGLINLGNEMKSRQNEIRALGPK